MSFPAIVAHFSAQSECFAAQWPVYAHRHTERFENLLLSSIKHHMHILRATAGERISRIAHGHLLGQTDIQWQLIQLLTHIHYH